MADPSDDYAVALAWLDAWVALLRQHLEELTARSKDHGGLLSHHVEAVEGQLRNAEEFRRSAAPGYVRWVQASSRGVWHAIRDPRRPMTVCGRRLEGCHDLWPEASAGGRPCSRCEAKVKEGRDA